MLKRFAKYVCLSALAACGSQDHSARQNDNFDIGSEQDPIVAQAKQQLVSTDTVTLTIPNNTNYDFATGILSTSTIFTVGQTPSSALMKYVSSAQTLTYANPTLYALSTGLTLNTNIWSLPAIKKGKSITITVAIPSNSTVQFVFPVSGAVDDFAGIQALNLNTLSPGVNTVRFSGYDPNDTGGKIGVGNGTVGSSPNLTLTIQNANDCPVLSARRINFVNEVFATGANSSKWPLNGAGWDGDFGGDWYTDGVTVRLWNPNWGGGGPINVVSGFWKYADICPPAGSRMTIATQMSTSFTDPASDTTLVLYYFDRSGGLLSVDTSGPLHGTYGTRSYGLYDSAIPAGARRMAIAPMAKLATAEQGTVFFDALTADYEAADTYTTRSTVATDTFTTCGASSYGSQQPSGWAEFGGDFYCLPPNAWVTLGNPKWAGKALPVDTGLTKQFTLPTFSAGDQINLKAFVASQFTDLASFARLRIVFNDSAATTFESERQGGGYGPLFIRRKTIPTTATKATVIVNGYLGSKEASSFYASDLSLTVGRVVP